MTSARVSYACVERSGLAGPPFTVGDTYHPHLSWRNLDMERQRHDMELQAESKEAVEALSSYESPRTNTLEHRVFPDVPVRHGA